MSIFGSYYPPGCSGPPDQPEDCAVCGAYDIDQCTCPECRVCGTVGDPKCYDPMPLGGHGLCRSQKQIDLYLARLAHEEEQARGEAEWIDRNAPEVEAMWEEEEAYLKKVVETELARSRNEERARSIAILQQAARNRARSLKPSCRTQPNSNSALTQK